VHQHDQQLCLG
jgi:hypothetical protein